MSIYQFNPASLPDSAFERGELAHLVIGNTGRLLDPRRTPFTIVDMRPATGQFVLRIEDFEDRGVLWEVPMEDVLRYQFARGSARASESDLARHRDAIGRLDRPLIIQCDANERATTEAALAESVTAAKEWMASSSAFLAAGAKLPDTDTRRGDANLCDDLKRWMSSRSQWEMDDAVATHYARYPNSGELVKGHRIVLAEMGLVPYEGKIVRNPATFDGPWARRRRRDHILARLAFIRAMFAALDRQFVILYRGLNAREPGGAIEKPRNVTFTSATFNRAVAESHFNVGEELGTRALFRQAVPIQRLFMSYLETEALNRQWLEAEAVLLWEPGISVF